MTEKKELGDLAHKQLDRVLSFFARVEAKASFGFAVNSALLGVVAVHIERSDLERWQHLIALGAFAIGIAVSYYFIYRCSFPNLAGGHKSLVYFKEVGKLREVDYIASFRAMSSEAYIDDVLGQTWRNSQILAEKFWAVRIAFIATGFALLPWTAFLILASINHAPALQLVK